MAYYDETSSEGIALMIRDPWVPPIARKDVPPPAPRYWAQPLARTMEIGDSVILPKYQARSLIRALVKIGVSCVQMKCNEKTIAVWRT